MPKLFSETKSQTYRNIGRTMAGYPCVTLSDCLSGKGGEIWQVGGSTYRAFYALSSGNEKIITFGIDELPKYLKRFKITPGKLADMIFWANNPNARHDKILPTPKKDNR